jgi:hypothetical protein
VKLQQVKGFFCFLFLVLWWVIVGK